MEENKLKIVIFIILLITGIWLWKDNKKIDNLNSQLVDCQNELRHYKVALDEANSNIEEVNSTIDDAQSYAWSSYDEMGYALDNLTTVDTVQP